VLTCARQLCHQLCPAGQEALLLLLGILIDLLQTGSLLRICGAEPVLLAILDLDVLISNLLVQLLQLLVCHPAETPNGLLFSCLNADEGRGCSAAMGKDTVELY